MLATMSRHVRSRYQRHARLRDERGQTLALFALMLVALLAATGFVIDVGGAWGMQRDQQKVADVAALAGATAEANGATHDQIIAAALASATGNGYQATEVHVNIPPTQGAYAPGGNLSGPLSTNDCSTPAKYPCWVEVILSRPHENTFSKVVGLNSFPVSGRGVAVGGIANTVTNGAAPIMFNYQALQSGNHPFTHGNQYCDPNPSHCSPNNSWPLNPDQFAWTTFCVSNSNCNVNASTAKNIIDGGNFQQSIYLNMYLGPHNNGDMTSVCHELLAQNPNGADLPVAINDQNGDLVGWWIWHFDPATTSCTPVETIGGWFVTDETATLPLTISTGGGSATFGIEVIRLVE
ncbi:MAG TPA: pilus assembly protein TadG-related protein [Candidatus Limnocylindrales bacterium]|jgi:hypothetical protein